MKKIFLIILFQMALVMVKSFGQSNAPGIYLTKYTFSVSSGEVGDVKMKHGNSNHIKTISIAGEDAKAFKISSDHKITVRKQALKPGIKWADILLNLETTEGKFKTAFRLVNDEFINNKVIAHRGAWKNTGATENSIASLKNAIAIGCEGSEFDVHMSADSVLYIHHDAAVDSVSIARSTSSVLKNIKLSNGESLPTLERYLAAGTQQNKTKLILEIKISELGKESSIALTHEVVDMVERLHAQAWVNYISFDYDVCKEVIKLAPYAKVAYLNGDKKPADLVKDNLFGIDYHFSVLQKNADWIKEAKQNKLTVNVWTVNDQATMEGLLKEDVDFITTNEPELLLKLLKTTTP